MVLNASSFSFSSHRPSVTSSVYSRYGQGKWSPRTRIVRFAVTYGEFIERVLLVSVQHLIVSVVCALPRSILHNLLFC